MQAEKLAISRIYYKTVKWAGEGYGMKSTLLLRFLTLQYIVPTYNLVAFSLGFFIVAALVMMF
jgi:hypothetical protein